MSEPDGEDGDRQIKDEPEDMSADGPGIKSERRDVEDAGTEEIANRCVLVVGFVTLLVLLSVQACLLRGKELVITVMVQDAHRMSGCWMSRVVILCTSHV